MRKNMRLIRISSPTDDFPQLAGDRALWLAVGHVRKYLIQWGSGTGRYVMVIYHYTVINLKTVTQ